MAAAAATTGLGVAFGLAATEADFVPLAGAGDAGRLVVVAGFDVEVLVATGFFVVVLVAVGFGLGAGGATVGGLAEGVVEPLPYAQPSATPADGLYEPAPLLE